MNISCSSGEKEREEKELERRQFLELALFKEEIRKILKEAKNENEE